MQVKFPIMGLSYAQNYFAICGGGGSLKSGIKNTVDIYELSDSDPTGFTNVMSTDTGMELASGVAFSNDGNFVAVTVSSNCWIYSVDRKASLITLIVKFRTDFATNESSQSCTCYVGNSTILTGGEDGVVRVWKFTSLEDDSSENRVSNSTSPSLDVENNTTQPLKLPQVGDKITTTLGCITLEREYRGHNKRIRDIHVDPAHRNLVVSSSEDQSCHLWRLTETKTVYQFSKDDALDVAYNMFLKKPPLPQTGMARKHQFRCVRFAPDGQRLFTMLTPARGDSILIKWRPETFAQESNAEWRWVIDGAAIAADKPVASLAISQDNRFVCAAAVSGDMQIFLTSTLQKYRKASQHNHTFAITGMSFVPAIVDASASLKKKKSKAIIHLVSGGADKALLRHDVVLEGGLAISSTYALLLAIVHSLVVLLKIILGGCMTIILEFVYLFLIHIGCSYLDMVPINPRAGIDDIMAVNIQSPDALSILLTAIASLFVAFIVSGKSTVAGACFWNGSFALVASISSVLIATSSDLESQWTFNETDNDELLDYKISILWGLCCIVFLIAHAFVHALS